MRKILLDADKLKDPDTANDYIEHLFGFPEYYGRNLDAMHDCLNDVKDETTLCISRDSLYVFCTSQYAFRVLMVLGKAAEENPKLHLSFTW